MTPSLVVLGSTNPAKRTGVETALARAFDGQTPLLEVRDVMSAVPDQPWGDDETRRGAENRARAALRSAAPADAAVVGLGIEGGVAREAGALWSFSWAVAVTSTGVIGAARSGAFALPPSVADLIDEGVELGDACDRVFRVTGSKHAGGAVGLLTDGVLSRAELYTHTVLLALAPLLRADLYRR